MRSTRSERRPRCWVERDDGQSAGTLGALVANAAGAPVALVSVLGSAAGLSYLGLMLEIARRSVGFRPTDIHFPTPDGGSVQG